MPPVTAAIAAEEGDRAADAAPVVALSDRVLLERHLAGDPAAFPELMRRNGPSVHGYLVRSGIPEGDRDDAFQDVFVKVHRALGRGLPDGPVRPWLFTIVVNTARDAFRKKRVRAIVEHDERGGDDHPSRDARPDHAAEARETAELLGRALARLPLDQREVLLLSCVEGMSLDDAAAATGAPVNTVKTRLRRARLALAEAMHRHARVAHREGSR